MILVSRSYLKLMGPNLSKALQTLEDFVKENDRIISGRQKALSESQARKGLLSRIFGTGKTVIGTWDFSFEWKNDQPDVFTVLDLIKELDELLQDTGVRYSITTLDDPTKAELFESKVQVPRDIQGDFAVSYLKFWGPSISKAVDKIGMIVKEEARISEARILGDDSGPRLGHHDYAVFWSQVPLLEDIRGLISKIDQLLQDTGVYYTITTVKYLKEGKIAPSGSLVGEDKQAEQKIAVTRMNRPL